VARALAAGKPEWDWFPRRLLRSGGALACVRVKGVHGKNLMKIEFEQVIEVAEVFELQHRSD